MGSLTNYPFGLASFGIPLLGSVGGIPFTGKYFFVNPASGLDGNQGNSPQAALQTLTDAYDQCVAGRNDVVILIGDGSTAATARLSSTLVWAKNATHLCGITAPSFEAQRARISTVSGATTNLNPLIQVTASGCMFSNFSTFEGIGQASTDENLIEITGSRNYFGNVQLGGMGAAAGAARAGSYILYLNGGGENLFEHCAIGLETIQRSAANASVRVRNGAQRNKFIDCIFPMAASATSPLYVDVNATNALNGSSMLFKRCTFQNLVNISGALQPAVTATVAADANGVVFFDQCSTMAAKWAAAGAMVKVTGPAANGFSGGVFTNAADS